MDKDVPHCRLSQRILAHQPQFRPPLFVPGGKDCLRLRGLPFSATVQDVLDFLKEHAAYVVPAGVHMVYNTQVRLCCNPVGADPVNFIIFFETLALTFASLLLKFSKLV